MNLKLRYASSLFFVFCILALFTGAAVYCLVQTYYIATIVLIALLFIITFFLGKQLAKVFFTLSFLQFMKKKDGVVEHTACIEFIGNSVGKRRTEEEIEALAADIVDTLLQEGIIGMSDNKLILLTT